MPGMTWDADADRKLLLAIISAQSVKVDSPAVASILSVGEVTCTPRAVEERIKKLKKIAREQGLDSKPAATSSDPSTSSPTKKTPTPRKKKAAATENGGHDAGKADAEGSPTKKRRIATPKRGKKVGGKGAGTAKSQDGEKARGAGWVAINAKDEMEDADGLEQNGSIFGDGNVRQEDGVGTGALVNTEFEF